MVYHIYLFIFTALKVRIIVKHGTPHLFEIMVLFFVSTQICFVQEKCTVASPAPLLQRAPESPLRVHLLTRAPGGKNALLLSAAVGASAPVKQSRSPL